MSDAAIIKPKRRPRFRRSDKPPAFQLTDRDVEIVRQVARHRFLRSTHISQLLSSSHKKVCERLTLLYHTGYLDRPRQQLEYYVRNGGSKPYVYALGDPGARLLKECDCFDRMSIDWAQKNKGCTRNFLLHTLAVAEFRVALAVSCRAWPRVRLVESDELLLSAPKETQESPNPWSWRVRVQFKGKIAETGVFPDYVFALILPDGRRRPFVVECDRGTMPIERASLAQTSMMRKFIAYEATRAQAIHKSRFGWGDFRVLITTTSSERNKNMRELIERFRGCNPLFLLAAHGPFTEPNFFNRPWQSADGRLVSLI
jgi:hypothetical protein